MEYVTLGKTGRKVSRLGFGGATAGLKNYTGAFNPEDKSDRMEVIRAIHRAYELGVNYFDTAAGYGDGASESIFGEGLEDLPKDQIFLATKVGRGSGGQTRASLEQSLKRLRRDCIDLIQIHGSYYSNEDADRILEPGGMLETLERAKAEGLVKHIGFSIECQNVPLYRLMETGRFDVMQVQYNLLFQHPSDRSWQCGSMHDAERNGLGIVVMRTATSGIFQRWVRTVNPANTFDYTPALIQTVLSNELVDVALIGMRTTDIVEQNVAIANDLSGRIDLDYIHNRYAD